jgi:acyl-coenzyme A synthetase/AMP-(fatty) acid ligase
MEIPKREEGEPSSTLPSTVTYIGYHAAQRPEDVALVVNGREIAYGTFYRDIGKMAAALRGFGLDPSHAAGVEHPDKYLHWLVVLAFEALGVPTFSYAREEAVVLENALAATELVMCSPGVDPPKAKRVQPMDREWIDSVQDLEPEYPPRTVPIGPSTPLRIVKSSGTTGSIKWMIHTGRIHAFWIGQYQFRTGFNRHSRFLITMGFTVEASHVYATACIRMGGICVHDEREGIAKALAKYSISHVTLLPLNLVQVLDELPGNYVKAPELTIFTIGAPVSKTIRAQVKQVLANDLMESYGTNEVAAICTMGDDGVGTVMPGVQVEVVDDENQPVMDEAGRVRVMTEGSVAGYINDSEATRRMFRDGWFYPGDLAVMKENRTLRLIGRADDQLNIRGIKFAPAALEEKRANKLPVADLCLTTIADGEGVDQVWVVVELRHPHGLVDIKKKMAPLLPAMFGEARLMPLKRIPRTATGKVRRNKLNQVLRLAQARSATPPDRL